MDRRYIRPIVEGRLKARPKVGNEVDYESQNECIGTERSDGVR